VKETKAEDSGKPKTSEVTFKVPDMLYFTMKGENHNISDVGLIFPALDSRSHTFVDSFY
jgi:hypothetical protein